MEGVGHVILSLFGSGLLRLGVSEAENHHRVKWEMMEQSVHWPLYLTGKLTRVQLAAAVGGSDEAVVSDIMGLLQYADRAVTVDEGLVQAIVQVRKRGCRVSAIADASRETMAFLRRTVACMDEFDYIFSSGFTGVCLPDRRPIEFAVWYVGTTAGATLMVDASEANRAAAEGCGVRVLRCAGGAVGDALLEAVPNKDEGGAASVNAVSLSSRMVSAAHARVVEGEESTYGLHVTYRQDPVNPLARNEIPVEVFSDALMLIYCPVYAFTQRGWRTLLLIQSKVRENGTFSFFLSDKVPYPPDADTSSVLVHLLDHYRLAPVWLRDRLCASMAANVNADGTVLTFFDETRDTVDPVVVAAALAHFLKSPAYRSLPIVEAQARFIEDRVAKRHYVVYYPSRPFALALIARLYHVYPEPFSPTFRDVLLREVELVEKTDNVRAIDILNSLENQRLLKGKRHGNDYDAALHRLHEISSQPSYWYNEPVYRKNSNRRTAAGGMQSSVFVNSALVDAMLLRHLVYDWWDARSDSNC
mmetsp:Transcript_4517/g.12645  ORF Transcript_4517/g.12645 Transcript_4517/m.12645 type:complete len:530 (+) Transcript_4517:123-1712(+)|eukprot:CAMPEP_0119159220 /NCGR_PEP_ID=MMETSP1310-20130426/53655_1 /TAXON_ID=464262 /ORGANISM="Genus nov. species nov., Strain RCC2339" /LENGTH=529 /DNA_ID=CAMNT_0007151849 /DNA_START=59 /DNA_END=1648 /DNA_ORIENTATION=+